MATWADGRSRPVGRRIGQMAIDDLEREVGTLHNHKGTVFMNSSYIVIGRSQGTPPQRPERGHWADLSLQQIVRLANEMPGRKFVFLFVSLSNDRRHVNIWRLPLATLSAAVFDRPPKSNGTEWDMKIVAHGNGWWLGSTDVTSTFRQLPCPDGITD